MDEGDLNKKEVIVHSCPPSEGKTLGTGIKLPEGSSVGAEGDAEWEKKKEAIRNAEKSRTSTCDFADRIARESIAEFHRRKGTVEFKQTVLASILLHDERSDMLKVLSMGVGTKVLSSDLLASDTLGKRLRDCHAEVLARRGLLRVLYSDLSRPDSEGQDRLLEALGGERFRLREGLSLHMYTSSQPCGNATLKRWATCVKEKYRDLAINKWVDGSDHIRMQVTARSEGQIALLVKCSAPDASAGMDPIEIDTNPTAMDADLSQRVAAGFRQEGAMSSAQRCESQEKEEGKGDEKQQPPKRPETKRGEKKGSERTSCGPSGLIAPGTARPDSGRGHSMTCSDKMAKWNVLGLQGALLTRWLDPIFLSSCTVGRKYSRAHLERAVCCRLQDFTPKRVPELANLGAWGKGVHHLGTMQTSVKLDTGAISTASGGGASFAEAACLCWALGDETCEVIRGRSGMCEAQRDAPMDESSDAPRDAPMDIFSNTSIDLNKIGNHKPQRADGSDAGSVESRVSKHSLFRMYKHVAMSKGGEHTHEVYLDAKRAAVDYQRAKELLTGSDFFFKEWTRADPTGDSFSWNESSE